MNLVLDNFYPPPRKLTSEDCIKGLPCPLAREGNGTPLQYSCLENPMDRGAW